MIAITNTGKQRTSWQCLSLGGLDEDKCILTCINVRSVSTRSRVTFTNVGVDFMSQIFGTNTRYQVWMKCLQCDVTVFTPAGEKERVVIIISEKWKDLHEALEPKHIVNRMVHYIET